MRKSIRPAFFVEDIILMVDYIVEYFKRSRLTLRLLERNFSWPMIESSLI